MYRVTIEGITELTEEIINVEFDSETVSSGAFSSKIIATITIYGQISFDFDKSFMIDSANSIAAWSLLKPGDDDTYKKVSVELVNIGEIRYQLPNAFVISYCEHFEDQNGFFKLVVKEANPECYSSPPSLEEFIETPSKKNVPILLNKEYVEGMAASECDIAGEGQHHPLLYDSIPRNGERLVVNQGQAPTCGHNSCVMVLDTLGKSVDTETLIQKLPPGKKGVHMQHLATLMNSEGVPSLAFANRNVSDLARYTLNGTPVIVCIVDQNSGFSHAVVVDGVTTRNGVPVVAIRDPHGIQYFSPVSSFEKSFIGQVIVPKSALLK